MRNSDNSLRLATKFAHLYNVNLEQLKSEALMLNIRSPVASDRGVQVNAQAVLEAGDGDDANKSFEVAPAPEYGDFSKVEAVPELAIGRIEQNMEEAGRYVENCLQLRRQYCETAKLFYDAKLKFEEFYRLDVVHRDEVANGLYQLQWQDAVQEVAALTIERNGAQAVLNLIEAMSSAPQAESPPSAGVLSSQRIEEYVAGGARVARNTANDEKPAVENDSRSALKYRVGFDTATWSLTRQSAETTRAEKDARLTAANTRAAYFERDVDFRTRRAAVAREMAWAQIGEHSRESSPLNYAERLMNQRTLLNENLRFLSERVSTIALGMAKFYGITFAAPNPLPGKAIDQFAMWLVQAQEILVRLKRKQRLVMLTARSGNAAGQRVINIERPHLGVDRALLRGVAFEFFGKHHEPISIEVTPPADAVTAPPPSKLLDRLRVGRVCSYSPSSEPRPQYAEVLWNGNPEGRWTVQPPIDVDPKAIDAIVMYYWIVIDT